MKPTELINNYQISKTGFIINKKTHRPLKWDVSTGYARVVLSNNGAKKAFSVHRLVALLFIENPENKPCVNHIDGDKLNNCVNNLEWCTYSENEKHSFKNLGKVRSHSEETKRKIGEANKGNVYSEEVRKRMSERSKGKIPNNIRKVILNNNIVFNSITEASNKTGVSVSSIANNLTGRSKSTKTGIWTYAH